MSIFEEVKAMVSARNVAESYGLKVNHSGTACCPFHDDKNPSMKIDANHFHCFGCGAHGDVIGYVAKLYGLNQYDAACKIISDFSLNINVKEKKSEAEITEARQMITNHEKLCDIKNKLKKWQREQVDALLSCEDLIKESETAMMNESPHTVFLTNGFVYMMHMKSIIGYWLDILCMGTEDEVKEFFLTDGKEVSRVVANIKRAGADILGRNRKVAG